MLGSPDIDLASSVADKVEKKTYAYDPPPPPHIKEISRTDDSK